MNNITLALGAVIAITAALVLTTVETSVTQQAIAAGNSSSVGKDNRTQVPISSHPPCLNKAKSTAGNNTNNTAGNNTNSTAGNNTNSTAGISSHIVKSDLVLSGNNIVRIASNNPSLEPISSCCPCGNVGSFNSGSGNLGFGNSVG